LDHYGKATYDLNEIKKLLDDPKTRIITRLSRQEAVSVGYASEDDMVERVQKLKESEIYKTMDAKKKPGLMQDVYRTADPNFNLYIKLQKAVRGEGVIIQFKKV